MHRLLKEAYTKLDFVRKQYDELKKDKDIKELFNDMDDMDESLNAYIKFYNENYDIFQNGKYYRLSDPKTDDYAVFEYVYMSLRNITVIKK